jgi:hypothetical protein
MTFDDGEDNVIGQRLPADQIPEKLKSHYEKLESVSYQRYETEVIEDVRRREV